MKLRMFLLPFVICLWLLSLLSNAQVNPKFTENGSNRYLKDFAYLVLKQQGFGNSFLMFSNMASDDSKGGGGASDSPNQFKDFDGFTMTTDDVVLQQLWTKYYQGITYCNNLIDYTTAGTNSTLDQYRAEAYFMRGFFYFDLVKLFGGVPLYVSANVPLKPVLGRSSVSDVYAQIESDLLAAIPKLPAKLSLATDEKYRITRGAAKSLLGKAYLYEKKWQNAVDIFKEVINSGEYNLLAKYSDLWVTTNKFSTESILEFPYSSADADWSIGNGNLNAMYMGIRTIRNGSGIYKWGFGLCPVTQDLVDVFKAEKDTVRLKSTIIDEATLIKMGYTIDKSDVNSDYTGYYDNKHTALLADFKDGSMFSDKNEIVIRYADVLLMCAEALYMIGNQPEAQMYLNIVRSRAGLPAVASISLDVIYKERRLELGLEASRFNDLIRWGQAEAVLGKLGYTSKNNVWPIPEGEMFKNPNLTQNVGYVYTGPVLQNNPWYFSGKYFDNYKDRSDSIVKYQYNFAKTDSLRYSLMKFSQKTGNIIGAEFSVFDRFTNKWAISGKAIDTLDLNGHLLSETQYRYNFAKSTTGIVYWDTVYNYAYTYNSKGFALSYKYSKWMDKMWVPQSKQLLYPDNKGNDTLVSSLGYDPATKKYTAQSKARFVFNYNSNGKLDSIINLSTLYPDTLIYLKENKEVYYYDANGNISHNDHSHWNGSAYVNTGKDSYVYNNNGFMQSDIQQMWNTSTSLYDNTVKDVFTLNDNNKTKVLSHYAWHIGFEDWWIGDGLYRTYYYYTSPNQIKTSSLPGSELNVKIWPNPVSTDGVNVDFELFNNSDVRVLIYSIDGKVVSNSLFQKQIAGQHHETINVGELEKGIYMINVASGGSKHIEKIVVAE